MSVQQSGGMSPYLPRLVVGLISGALTGVFALAGALTGAITGALAGRASDSGIFRGAGLGAVAGAVLSVEVLEASRAYWCSERSGTRSSSSMSDFVEELLHGRFVQEQFAPMFTAYRWQVSIGDGSYDQIYNVYGDVASKGLSGESIKKLPWHVITDEKKAGCGDSVCCSICLQVFYFGYYLVILGGSGYYLVILGGRRKDLEAGDTVRSLQQCRHTFHLACVDKWLVRHGSCPVCRQNV
ncbi:hypothetical protein GIB67_007312 [Kingdonia uniflora]|uniref:RING-type domain-containing protein n=1 Tax=Kingdonia uniflora TaxID=39325 RepID=A0A7J7NX67_9MAGN|nr:hypothetical protein GIB67_007312 [Kingdonia uniflora]